MVFGRKASFKDPVLKPYEAAHLVDKNSRTMLKITQLLELSNQKNKKLIARKIEKLRIRLNRRLQKLAKWVDTPIEERLPPQAFRQTTYATRGSTISTPPPTTKFHYQNQTPIGSQMRQMPGHSTNFPVSGFNQSFPQQMQNNQGRAMNLNFSNPQHQAPRMNQPQLQPPRTTIPPNQLKTNFYPSHQPTSTVPPISVMNVNYSNVQLGAPHHGHHSMSNKFPISTLPQSSNIPQGGHQPQYQSGSVPLLPSSHLQMQRLPSGDALQNLRAGLSASMK